TADRAPGASRMKYRRLIDGLPELGVVGLGTMTWGEQNSEAEAHAQMDYALAHGVNLFDAAEMYPVPPRRETQGRTEQYIGSWLQKSGARKRIVLATKITGPGDFPYLRGGTHLDRKSVLAACEGSLRRLQTDVIDLYQVHWPERNTNYFGKLGYAAREEAHATPVEETLAALAELVRAGKVRHVGVSNETPWGVGEYLRLAREKNLPRIASIQNPYSLLNRSFEVGLAEFAHREHLPLLAYSPLAMGVLAGKYLHGARPAGARMSLFTRFTRYLNEEAELATREYVALAQRHGLDPAQMALAFVHSRPFVACTLIGATSMEQLKLNIASIDVGLNDELLKAIEAIHRRHTIPCP
ncbi:MAG TPA: NADP(H)-dependent aldo-keto reductase, partial [Nevskiaceae bacterium]|nr:NADP(H)-dependent aldo-keto reductase [Nevskiaceae bacterium]